ncbi:high affinity immunoglobulin epsilon receptor subunit alpha [Mustela lutreola]|uniref:high affinity immunoglobulin epsilon receptor subunit alpha n=1 Tax=Mustela lutreola TaxID=9666 RepID=UPI002797AB55|nr:high affinity immunoglobulin epsilon receptor subunit alpha [Mustela lutreola]
MSYPDMIQKTFPSPFWLQVYFKASSLQSNLHLGAAEEMPVPMGGPVLLWMVWLLFSPHSVSADISKPMVSLNPPWNRILKYDNVTLICYENNSLEVISAMWTHNERLLENKTSRFNIVKARPQDSGEYRCRDKESNVSDPVYLEVFSEWLLLQAAPEELTEGESFHIRCHSWKNWNITKVTYYRNGKALKYGYENFEMSIPNATIKDNGSYYCTGWIKKQNHTSNTINIIVKKNYLDHSVHQRKTSWLQYLIPLLVVILFAVDTGLFILTHQQLTLILKTQRTRKNKKPDPEKK